MSIVNTDRDFFATTLKDTDELGLGTVTLVSTNSVTVNANATVYDGNASCRFDKTSAPTIAANSWAGIASYIRPPDVEAVPYRVKAYGNPTYQILAVGIGYCPASPTGTNDVIDPVAVFPFETKFDELFMIPSLDSADPYYGRSLAFCLICYYSAGFLSGGLSVQNLSTVPPMYSASVR